MKALDRQNLPLDFDRLDLVSRMALVLIEAIPLPIFCKTEDGRYLDGNGLFFKFIGKTRSDVVGHTVYELFDTQKAEIYDAADQELWAAGGVQEYEGLVDTAEGAVSTVRFHKQVITLRPDSRRVMVGIILDITDLRDTETRLQKAVRTDELTGLHNRKAFVEYLKATCLRIRRQHVPFALLALDLDGFKSANDHFGHAAGDHVLQIIAERFNSVVRETDYVARIGGDEFMIVLEGIEDEVACRQVTDKILSTVKAPIVLPDGNEVTVGVSIGVNLCQDNSCNTDSLMDVADSALYCAKASGRGRACFASQMKSCSVGDGTTHHYCP